ncbi:MAG TPA: hypothetical protein VNU97_01860 [Rhizomicrobium sp.]|jgi:hypothetical protein|nr:hypothetical protein [Rhizomicrobium sp.]
MKLFAYAMAAALLIATPALAEDLQIKVKNDTSTPMTEVYVSHVGTDSWEENILNGTVAPGEDLEVTIADGRTTCEYDIKAVFSDGGHAEFRNQNLCETAEFSVHD